MAIYTVFGSIFIGLALYSFVDCLFEKQKKRLRFRKKINATAPETPIPSSHNISVDEMKLNEEIQAINKGYYEDEDESDELD